MPRCQGVEGDEKIDQGNAAGLPSSERGLSATSTRREVLSVAARLGALAGMAGVASTLAACRNASAPVGDDNGPIVIYTSVDDFIAQPIIARAREVCSEKIDLITDTEATKTTGLLQRLMSEHASNRFVCDIWWSNEALATCNIVADLSAKQLPTPQGSFLAALPPDLSPWPDEYAGFASDATIASSHWAGLAMRTRVIAYSTTVYSSPPSLPPQTLEELFTRVGPGRIAMAKPLFGTTRSFFAALVHEKGEAWTREFAQRLRAQGVQLLPGNSAVVRAIAQGSADAGLTDSDDVFVGQRQGWKVDFADVRDEKAVHGLDAGRLLIPCTVAMMPRACGAAAQPARTTRAANVMRQLLSLETETLLATSEAVHRPIREALATELGAKDPRLLRIGTRPVPAWSKIAAVSAKSDALVRELFGL